MQMVQKQENHETYPLQSPSKLQVHFSTESKLCLNMTSSFKNLSHHYASKEIPGRTAVKLVHTLYELVSPWFEVNLAFLYVLNWFQKLDFVV